MNKNGNLLNFTLSVPLLFILFATSCNIKNLKEENEELHDKVSAMERKINSLREENDQLAYTIEQMRLDMREIQRYARAASNNASSIVFWSNTGTDDSFLIESEFRNMSSNFDNIALIASKY